MRRFLSWLALTLFFVARIAFAYSSPGNPSGYVNDFASLLNQEEKTTLETTLTNFHSQYGGEVVVATIPNLGGDAIENYANQLFREWSIGQKDKNNGVLLLVSKEDHKLRIEVGYGYEGVLTDARSSEIIRNTITPYFKQGAYGLGIMTGVRDIITTVTTGEVPLTAKDAVAQSNGGSFNIPTILFFLFIALQYFASIFGRSKSWWAGGVVGGVIGGAIAVFIGSMTAGLFVIAVLVIIGLVFDFVVSRGYQSSVASGGRPPWWTGGGSSGGSSSGGGFGGFSGGSSGGGGASGSW
jgi:uncharacterized protein